MTTIKKILFAPLQFFLFLAMGDGPALAQQDIRPDKNPFFGLDFLFERPSIRQLAAAGALEKPHKTKIKHWLNELEEWRQEILQHNDTEGIELLSQEISRTLGGKYGNEILKRKLQPSIISSTLKTRYHYPGRVNLLADFYIPTFPNIFLESLTSLERPYWAKLILTDAIGFGIYNDQSFWASILNSSKDSFVPASLIKKIATFIDYLHTETFAPVFLSFIDLLTPLMWQDVLSQVSQQVSVMAPILNLYQLQLDYQSLPKEKRSSWQVHGWQVHNFEPILEWFKQDVSHLSKNERGFLSKIGIYPFGLLEPTTRTGVILNDDRQCYFRLLPKEKFQPNHLGIVYRFYPPFNTANLKSPPPFLPHDPLSFYLTRPLPPKFNKLLSVLDKPYAIQYLTHEKRHENAALFLGHALHYDAFSDGQVANLYLKKSADLGLATAQFFYANELYKQRDWEGSRYYYQQAAFKGLVQAQVGYAILLWMHAPHPTDNDRAYQYLKIAAYRGDPIAQRTWRLVLRPSVKSIETDNPITEIINFYSSPNDKNLARSRVGN